MYLNITMHFNEDKFIFLEFMSDIEFCLIEVFTLLRQSRDNAIHPSLYPVLVILSRLYPSTMDGADTVLSMAMFVPYVTR